MSIVLQVPESYHFRQSRDRRRGMSVRIAICVCTCKRPTSLERLLDSLVYMRLDDLAPETVEVIVIDNSPDGVARQICQAVSPRLPVKLRFEEEPQRGISFARNRAVDVALAHGAEFVAFVDDDDVPEPDWLCQLVARQRETGASIVFGRWSYTFDSDAPSWMRKSPKFKASEYPKRNIYGLPSWAGTGNVLISSSLLQQMATPGPVFSPEFALVGGEDKDFFIRATAVGARFVTTNLSMVHRPVGPEHSRISTLLRRSFRVGCSTVFMSRKHQADYNPMALRAKATKKILRAIITLPSCVLSRVALIEQVCRISKSLGLIYATMGGSYNHYGRT